MSRTLESRIALVDGWLHPEEARLLFRLAKRCKGRGGIVEIGSWKGKSTICLGHGSLAGRRTRVHAIDPHTGSPEHSELFGSVWTFDEFCRNIDEAGVRDVVVPHVDGSTNVAERFNEPVELIFIDGLHEYEGVKADFDAWFPKVIPNGTMAFHDSTCWPGVLKVVSECVFKSPRFRKVRFTRSIVYGEKVARATAMEQLANRLRYAWFLAHAWMDRFTWRLTHRYLDCRLTRALIAYAKQRRQAKAFACADRTREAKSAATGPGVTRPA
ncbi:MAG TPA: class I SAM-dependent methyltransferase [Verrucomicrobia bacterium]|nr:class I SAM-dependent methyltransferase [Verrucomicrobiota bacterium]HOP98140.1 class I SAM-dependent methyltransferase [Verrucomicrobiota bacterium]HPU56820.1 class I SAM-dependent methyltransferase [Verrucomicrobiota bacterium]